MAHYDPTFVASKPDHTEWKGDQNAIFLDEDFIMTTPVFAEIAGGTAPYTYSMEATNLDGSTSALPDGLSLNTETGFITGKPTETGSFDATFKVVDSTGSRPDLADTSTHYDDAGTDAIHGSVPSLESYYTIYEYFGKNRHCYRNHCVLTFLFIENDELISEFIKYSKNFKNILIFQPLRSRSTRNNR